MTEVKALIETKLVANDIEVEYEVISPSPTAFRRHKSIDWRESAIETGLRGLKEREAGIQFELDTLNTKIDRLTNHADGVDYAVAVSSGVLASAVDSFWVGEFSFQRGKAWSNKTVNDFVMKIAKGQGYSGDRLDGAIKFLEDKFRLPSDNVWKGADIGVSARSHHLDDFAHHPSIIGLFFSILTQFTQEAYFSNKDGDFLPITLDEDGRKFIGHDVPTKIFCGTVSWFMHLVSDMSGSNKTAGAGMGIPGPIVSMLKELSALPIIKDRGLAKIIYDGYTKEKFDLRSEMTIGHELGRQALPVLLNEAIVRAFYFIRRLISEIKEKPTLDLVDWKKTLPWKNRTIGRMLTIAHGTFTAIDLSDAAIRAGIKAYQAEAAVGGASGGAAAASTFTTDLILRVNFVGIGRFGVAFYSDMQMGWQLVGAKNERLTLECQQLQLMQAKVFYKQAGMWVAAENSVVAVQRLTHTVQQAIAFQVETSKAINKNELAIKDHAKKLSPQVRSDLLKKLKWI